MAVKTKGSKGVGQKALEGKDLLKDTVEVCGVEFPRRTYDEKFQCRIPRVNPNYVFRDFTFDFCMDLLENESIMLVGLPGAGKTSLPFAVGGIIRRPVFRNDIQEGTKLSDIVGAWKVVKGEMVWVDGPLTTAMRVGGIYVANEWDYASAGVCGGLNTVLEPISGSNPVRTLVLDEHDGEYIEAHPDFRIVSTCNSVGNMQKFKRMFPNAKPVNAATLDRYRVYLVPYMNEDEEVRKLMGEFGLDASIEDYVRKFVRLANRCRLAFEAEEFRFLFTPRRLEMLFKHVGRHSARWQKEGVDPVEWIVKSAQAVIKPLCADDEMQTIESYIKTIFV